MDEQKNSLGGRAGAGDAEAPSAASYARAQLTCREVREDIVALQREELSALRATSVRQHLSACPECREEALELDLAARSFQRLPLPEPRREVVARTLERARQAYVWAEAPESASLIAAREAGSRSTEEPRRAPSPAEAPSEGGEAPAPDGKVRWLFRPVRNVYAAIAVAAFFMFAAVTFHVPQVGEAVGRAQRRVLGSRITQAIERATDAVLARLRM
jgi:hypothetical protein